MTKKKIVHWIENENVEELPININELLNFLMEKLLEVPEEVRDTATFEIESEGDEDMSRASYYIKYFTEESDEVYAARLAEEEAAKQRAAQRDRERNIQDMVRVAQRLHINLTPEMIESGILL